MSRSSLSWVRELMRGLASSGCAPRKHEKGCRAKGSPTPHSSENAAWPRLRGKKKKSYCRPTDEEMWGGADLYGTTRKPETPFKAWLLLFRRNANKGQKDKNQKSSEALHQGWTLASPGRTFHNYIIKCPTAIFQGSPSPGCNPTLCFFQKSHVVHFLSSGTTNVWPCKSKVQPIQSTDNARHYKLLPQKQGDLLSATARPVLLSYLQPWLPQARIQAKQHSYLLVTTDSSKPCIITEWM